MALFVLKLSHYFPQFPDTGLFPLVLAHFLLNVFFLSSIFSQKLYQWKNGGGAKLYEYLQTIPLKRGSVFKFFHFPVLKRQFQIWTPLVFLWSFNAFATVLILSGAPRNANPEVLLFYSISQDPFSSRTTLLCLIQLITGLSTLYFIKASKAFSFSSAKLQNAPTQIPSVFPYRFFSIFMIVTIFCLWAIPLISVFQTSFQELPHPRFFYYLKNSLLLSILCMLFSFIFASTLFLISTKKLQRLFTLTVFSPSLLLLGQIQSRLDLVLSKNSLIQLPICALILSALFVPFLALWVEQEKKDAPRALKQLCFLYGLSPLQKLLYFYRFESANFLKKTLLLSFLIGMGEITYSQFLLKSWTPLALAAKKATESYDFSFGSWTLIVLIGCSLFSFLIHGGRHIQNERI